MAIVGKMAMHARRQLRSFIIMKENQVLGVVGGVVRNVVSRTI